MSGGLTKQELLEPLARLRGDAIVVTSMGTVRPSARLSTSPLDFASADSALGHTADFALGLALDFAGLARAAGIWRVHSFEDKVAYGQALPELLEGEGPVAVVVRVEPGDEAPLARAAPGEPPYLSVSLAESTRRLRATLTGSGAPD